VAIDAGLAAIAGATPGTVGADPAVRVDGAALLDARRAPPAADRRCFRDALERIQRGAARRVDRAMRAVADERLARAHRPDAHLWAKYRLS
jgi:ATP-dependent Zn protease